MTLFIRDDIPIPTSKYIRSSMQDLRDQCNRLHIGEAFMVDTTNKQSAAHIAARDVGIAVKTAKINGKGYEVRRVK